jgi:putative membrane protein
VHRDEQTRIQIVVRKLARSGKVVYGPGPGDEPPPEGRPGRFWVLLIVGVAMVATLIVVAALLFNGTLTFGARPYPGYWGGFFLIIILLWVSFFLIRMAFWSTMHSRRQYYRQQYRAGMGRDPAIMEARRRYARGEITREQFDQIMTDLERRGRGPGGPLSGA